MAHGVRLVSKYESRSSEVRSLLACRAINSGFGAAEHEASVRFSRRSVASPSYTTLLRVFVFFDRWHNTCAGVLEEVSSVFSESVSQ